MERSRRLDAAHRHRLGQPLLEPRRSPPLEYPPIEQVDELVDEQDSQSLVLEVAPVEDRDPVGRVAVGTGGGCPRRRTSGTPASLENRTISSRSASAPGGSPALSGTEHVGSPRGHRHRPPDRPLRRALRDRPAGRNSSRYAAGSSPASRSREARSRASSTSVSRRQGPTASSRAAPPRSRAGPLDGMRIGAVAPRGRAATPGEAPRLPGTPGAGRRAPASPAPAAVGRPPAPAAAPCRPRPSP